jgi:Tfp pilus assembly protein PilF
MIATGAGRTLLLLALAVAAAACDRLSATKQAAEPQVEARSPLEDARAQLDQDQPDAALATLSQLPSDADTLYLQGLAWARKAEAAPLPTPPPDTRSLPRGAEPPAASEFKPEELTALDLLERAAATRPGHAEAELAVAELLAPHAARLQARLDAAQRSAGRRGKRGAAAAPAPAEGGPDYGADRVIEAYRAALRGDPASWKAAQGLATFAMRVGRLDEADAAFRELIRRDKENPEQLVRYGDFLATARKDPMAAVDYYRQALIWRPDDEETRGKVADVFIAIGVEHFQKQEYAVAEARFAEAEKYISDRGTPRGIRIQDYQGRLRSIRPKGER